MNVLVAENTQAATAYPSEFVSVSPVVLGDGVVCPNLPSSMEHLYLIVWSANRTLTMVATERIDSKRRRKYLKIVPVPTVTIRVQ